jgi:halimadienyl-diphosphate synthase
MIEKVHQLLKDIGAGTMSSLAYDTAWAARLGDIDREVSNQALEWLSDNQLPDGSWGAETPFNYYDRVASTLAAILALAKSGRRASDKQQVERGKRALERIISDTTPTLTDPINMTTGFELIVPALVSEAKTLGLLQQHGELFLTQLVKFRSEKLARLNGKTIDRKMASAFSAELAGHDQQHLLDIDNLQEINGSVGNSPSATAYFALYLRPDDANALEYMNFAIEPDGGMGDLYPFDVYERAWVLWNLSLIGELDQPTLDLVLPHLEYLCKAWKPKQGLGFSKTYSVPDGADSFLAYGVLDQYQFEMDVEAILAFEEENHFRCYDLEANTSISVNVHALATLRQIGYPPDHPIIQKILHFLQREQSNKPYWLDKWHSSPYFATSHLITACAGYQNDLAQSAVDWILSSQNVDGTWGFFGPTTEETAYCIQALCIWERETGKKVRKHLANSTKWLQDHLDDPHPPLWIGKGLYCPTLIVRSTLLSALALSS